MTLIKSHYEYELMMLIKTISTITQMGKKIKLFKKKTELFFLNLFFQWLISWTALNFTKFGTIIFLCCTFTDYLSTIQIHHATITMCSILLESWLKPIRKENMIIYY